MKKVIMICLFGILFCSIGCEADKRITIKIIETKSGYFEWYYYSLITGDSPDYIDFVNDNCERNLIFEGHNVIDLNQKGEVLYIECYKCDTIELNSYKKNKTRIIQNNNYFDLAQFLLERDSMKMNVKINKCY